MHNDMYRHLCEKRKREQRRKCAKITLRGDARGARIRYNVSTPKERIV